MRRHHRKGDGTTDIQLPGLVCKSETVRSDHDARWNCGHGHGWYRHSIPTNVPNAPIRTYTIHLPVEWLCATTGRQVQRLEDENVESGDLRRIRRNVRGRI